VRIPGIEKALKLLWPTVIGGFVIGAVGGFVGHIVFGRLRDTQVLKRLRAE
jgi:hypothetical protein